jgi:hypothetical protein
VTYSPSVSVAEVNPDRDGSAVSISSAHRPARASSSTAAAAKTEAPAPDDPASTGSTDPNADQSVPGSVTGSTRMAVSADAPRALVVCPCTDSGVWCGRVSGSLAVLMAFVSFTAWSGRGG